MAPGPNVALMVRSRSHELAAAAMLYDAIRLVTQDLGGVALIVG